MIFVDTSALYAVLDRDDANHGRARVAWEQLLGSSSPLFTHNYVLVETCALVQNRLGIAALRALEDDIAPVLQVEWIAESQHRAAVHMVVVAGRRKLSVVDCASFLVMRSHGVNEVFTFDRHFGEQGFQVIPEQLRVASED